MQRKEPVRSASIEFKVQNAAGNNLMFNRDVLRRTYGAVKDLCSLFYHSDSAPEYQLPRLSISFLESTGGEVLFTVDELTEASAPRRSLLGLSRAPAAEREVSGPGESALRNAVFLAHATKFVIERGRVHGIEVKSEPVVDLVTDDDSHQLRVPRPVARALTDQATQETLRQLFAAVGEEGVAAIVIVFDPGARHRRMEFIVPATDAVVNFVAGHRLPVHVAS